MPLPYGEPFLHTRSHSPPASTKTSNWGPYANAGEFGASMVIILVTLFSSLILALALIAVLRFLLCGRRHPPPRAPVNDSDKQAGTAAISVAETLPTLVFSTGTKLASTEPVCAICLSEFADGDSVRVLPACNHGFHVKCIEGWLSSRCTCPTCRSSCRLVAPKSGVEEA